MEARAIQYAVRQSARKMRLVIDLIRGHAVPEADAILRFSKKRAARQIHKVLKSAVANAQQAAQRQNTPFDADGLRVTWVAAPVAPAPRAKPAEVKAEAKAKAKPRAKKAPAAKARKKKTTKKASK